MRKRFNLFGGIWLVLLLAGVLTACGSSESGVVTDDVVVTDEEVVTDSEADDTDSEADDGDSAPAPGDSVTTEQKVPGGKAEEKETVAPSKDQGDCAPGEVEAGGGCIPNQPSG